MNNRGDPDSALPILIIIVVGLITLTVLFGDIKKKTFDVGQGTLSSVHEAYVKESTKLANHLQASAPANQLAYKAQLVQELQLQKKWYATVLFLPNGASMTLPNYPWGHPWKLPPEFEALGTIKRILAILKLRIMALELELLRLKEVPVTQSQS